MIRAITVIAALLAAMYLMAGYRDYRRLVRQRDEEASRKLWTEDDLP